MSDLLGKNSGNTHQPSSQDKFSKPKSLRAPSEKIVGGQQGHKGSRLEATDSPDEVVELTSASSCSACGSSALRTVGGQVFDLPPDFRLSVREYASSRKVCEGCGTVCQGEFPADVKAPTPYGSRIMALGVRLHERKGLPYARASALLRDMFGVAPAPATSEAAEKQMEAAVKDYNETVKAALRQENVVCCDETGLRVGGKNFWAHVFCTDAHTHISLSSKRGVEAIGAHLDGCSGTAVHDGWKSYRKFDCKHAVCNAHILRELQFLVEARNRFWATLFIGQPRLLRHEAKEAQRRGKNAVDDYPGVKMRFQDLIDAALLLHPPSEKVEGKRGRPKNSKERNLWERLSEHLDEALAFARDFAVPFDNNQAERDVRPLKVVQKIAGGWRTESGAKRQLSLRSFFSTCQKMGLNLIHTAIDAFNGALPRFLPRTVTT